MGFGVAAVVPRERQVCRLYSASVPPVVSSRSLLTSPIGGKIVGLESFSTGCGVSVSERGAETWQ
jgi:hypothetical protein